ncbi:MAG: cobalamin-dependent protein, partial [bacterium]
MKVQLIYPPLVPGEKPRYGLQPLGVLYLATYLQRHGVEASVIDGEIEGLTVDEIVRRIAASETDLVGISAMTPQLPVAFAIARQIKSLGRGIKTCLGGSHANATIEESLALCPDLDFVIYGEGEQTLLDLCRKLEAERRPLIDGLVYREDNGGIRRNPPRDFMQDIEPIHPLDYNLL